MNNITKKEVLNVTDSLKYDSNYSAVKASIRRKIIQKLGPDFNSGVNRIEMAKTPMDFKNIAPKEDFVIYIHMPFCDAFCRDCPYSKTLNKDSIERYCNALIREIELVGKSMDNTQGKLMAVYFGGGTPTTVPINLIEKIINKLKECFNKNNNISITLESNPQSLDCYNLQKYKDAGVNRLSIGIQSFHDSVLREMSRGYDSKRVLKVLEKAADEGWNFNVDLIYGFDSQTPEMFYEDIKKVLQFNANHISIYGLMRDVDTKTKEIMIKKETDMYFNAREKLLEYGFMHYKLNDFARNLDCINHYADARDRIPIHENLALGTSGHGMSFSAGNYFKFRSIDKYIESIEKGIPPLYYVNCNNKEGDIVSNILYGLNSLTIEREKFKDQFYIDPSDEPTNFIRNLARLGFLEITNKEIKVREDSLFEYNIIFNEIYYKSMKMPKDPD